MKKIKADFYVSFLVTLLFCICLEKNCNDNFTNRRERSIPETRTKYKVGYFIVFVRSIDVCKTALNSVNKVFMFHLWLYFYKFPLEF